MQALGMAEGSGRHKPAGILGTKYPAVYAEVAELLNNVAQKRFEQFFGDYLRQCETLLHNVDEVDRELASAQMTVLLLEKVQADGERAIDESMKGQGGIIASAWMRDLMRKQMRQVCSDILGKK